MISVVLPSESHCDSTLLTVTSLSPGPSLLPHSSAKLTKLKLRNAFSASSSVPHSVMVCGSITNTPADSNPHTLLSKKYDHLLAAVLPSERPQVWPKNSMRALATASTSVRKTSRWYDHPHREQVQPISLPFWYLGTRSLNAILVTTA